MNNSNVLEVLKTYHLGDSIGNYKGFAPIKDVEKKLDVSFSFFPFKIDYLLEQDQLPVGIDHLGISVLNNTIAGVYFLLTDTSSILPTLEGQYGPYDVKFTGIEGYGYNWKKGPCIEYSNTFFPYTTDNKRTVISIYACDQFKQIVVESFSKYLED
ncbi:hypothetical protein FHW36_105464 [Chitinophaga polysaccharea]|uniref:Uncharacterized protein n=1 Tax=Chitinophaga polysaccharea TaxID=1293035 RepID=A0A561PPJ8_9BACT|nr:hypothetical protein [Chitinophaga polysaccharea]TWF40023.1 hypothetical protein FHW36_105464 [Chitinophaga polysaccharea]